MRTASLRSFVRRRHPLRDPLTGRRGRRGSVDACRNRFATDGNKSVGKAYGANGMLWHTRHLYVIDPQGRIAYLARPFNQMSEDAYAALAAAVTAASTANSR